MNDLREKIITILREQTPTSSDGWTADRILALLPKPEAEAKLPEGVEIVSDMIDAFQGRWIVKRGLYRLDHDDKPVWSKAAYIVFNTHADALAAALKAPPVPTETKSRDGFNPNVTRADMRRLATLGEEQG